MSKLAKFVQPVHFDDFDGFQFERLVFAYHVRTDRWDSLEWYGQTGSDLGRDIWGVRDDDTKCGESVCIQCANRKRLTFAKIESDLGKVLKSPHGTPKRFRVVASSNVSSDLRDRIKAFAGTRGITKCDVWSGAEFEEYLRHGAESLLKRFCEGEEFPDAELELRSMAQAALPLDDAETISLMARLFDRPAFYTPIHRESSLPAFKQAITDTIKALGTGIWKTREGEVIARIPSRHQLRSATLREQIRAVEIALAKLRDKYDAAVRTGAIRHCNCGDADCPTYFIELETCESLSNVRRKALSAFKEAAPEFKLPEEAW